MINYADTAMMREIATSISHLVLEYNQEINNLYNRLSRVPYETKEWVGNSSEYYFKQVLLDKTNFIDFGSEILEYSKKINKDIENIEETIKKNDNLES